MVEKKEDSPKTRELKHQARRHSIKEGIFYSAKFSLGDYYISPFAIAINTSNSMVALLTSLSGLLSPLSQLFGSRLIEKYSRKKIVSKATLFEALMWIPMITIAVLFYFNIITNILPLSILFIFSIYSVFVGVSYPAWFSWMGDVVDEEYRGRWFSKRNLIIGFTTIIFAISASFLLDYFKNKNMTMQGFILLFALAFIARIICWRIFQKQYEPKINLKKEDYFSFSEFILNAHKNNFGKFSIFRSLLGFACSISSPLIAVYFLRNLGFSYTTYIVITLSGTFFSLLVMNLWGRIADRFGNYKVLGITTIAIPIIPILYILHPSPFYLIFVPCLTGGISWAGFNLAAGNFIYDNVSPHKRGLAVSYYNMLWGIGVFLGAGLGAILIKYLSFDFIQPIKAIFLIGAFTRMIVVSFLISKIKEIRKTEKTKSKRKLKNILIKEAKASLIEEAHELMGIRGYLKEK